MEKKKVSPKKTSVAKSQKRLNLERKLHVAGYKCTIKELHARYVYAGIILGFLCGLFFGIKEYLDTQSLYDGFVGFLFWGAVSIPVAYVLIRIAFVVYTEFRIAGRREQIEKALPDYLQMAASNIRAGMPLDRAMWLAIRPKFGLLAVEMENVAKQTYSGDKLEDALISLSNKYDSAILRRTIVLIIEGLRSGSEIGSLLENISLDITDMYQRRANMAANVTQYLIFISFAVIVAAPLLFGMSVQLLTILNTMGGQLAQESTATIPGFSAMSFTGEAVAQSDYIVFCIIALVTTCILSSVIISNIKNGHSRDAAKNAPVFIVISLTLFFVANWIISYLFAGLL